MITINEATLGILLEMQDNATPQIRAVKREVTGVGSTLTENKAAFRELAMGVTYLGSTFMGLGVSMQASNNQTVKNMGSTMMLAGGLMTSVGAAVQFISAISKIIDTLKKLRTAQILAQAFTPGLGWLALLGGAAVAGGAIYGMSKMETAQAKVKSTAGKAQTNITVTQHIAGSVVTERQLTDNVHRALLLKEQRSYQTGIK